MTKKEIKRQQREIKLYKKWISKQKKQIIIQNTTLHLKTVKLKDEPKMSRNILYFVQLSLKTLYS